MLKIEVSGMKELSAVLKKIPEDIRGESKTALKKICANLQAESVKLAPKKTGALRRSCHYEVADTGKGLSAYVGYFVPYATRQHESLTYRHTQGQAKFLETPFKQNSDKYIEYMTEAIRKAAMKK